jgi:hypothetical protein
MPRHRFSWTRRSTVSLLSSLCLCGVAQSAASPALQPAVEVEEDVYSYEPANNGAGPMWCSGSTCLVRIGTNVFASGIETLKDRQPLNNCRWTLFRREAKGWVLQRADPKDRTREPSPLVGFADGRLFLSVNPTLSKAEVGGGPARPALLEFSANDPRADFTPALPVWNGKPEFTEHSYRSFTTDAATQDILLLQNIGYTHAEWALMEKGGKWTANGRLVWPDGKDYPKPEPIRVCYPDVAIKNHAVHFCGVSDIIEPYPEWRAFKKSLTKQEWDYDFRRLFYTWTPDITKEPFREWVEIASRDKTCGWISPGDLWVAPDGAAHIVWTERAIDERLRAKFFPEARQSQSMNYAIVVRGEVKVRRQLTVAEEGKTGIIAGSPRFQVTPDNRLFVAFYASGTAPDGKGVSENRLMEIQQGGEPGPVARIPLKAPFTSFFTATPRGGSAPSTTLDMLGQQAGKPQTISYARVRLW